MLQLDILVKTVLPFARRINLTKLRWQKYTFLTLFIEFIFPISCLCMISDVDEPTFYFPTKVGC